MLRDFLDEKLAFVIVDEEELKEVKKKLAPFKKVLKIKINSFKDFPKYLYYWAGEVVVSVIYPATKEDVKFISISKIDLDIFLEELYRDALVEKI